MAIAINPIISIVVSIFLVLVFVFLCAASGEIKMFIFSNRDIIFLSWLCLES